MTASQVVREKDLIDHLKKLGFEQTNEKTETGIFWRSPQGRHIQVPYPYEGMYPDWLLSDLVEIIGKVTPSLH